MRQCIFVVGTRAQLVKISPVLRLAMKSGLRHTVWFTGQHHESIDDLIADFELTSNFVQLFWLYTPHFFMLSQLYCRLEILRHSESNRSAQRQATQG